MKKTNALINAAIAVLFVGVLLYLGVYLIRSFNNGYVTAKAIYVELQESGQAQGLIVRNETVLFSGKPYVDILAEDGKNVAVGEVIATATDTETSMADAARIHELEMEISRAETMAGTTVSSGNDEAVVSALYDLSAAVARGDIPQIYSPEVTIASLLFRNGEQRVDDAQLREMKAELSQLKAQAASGVTAVSSPAAGLFTTAVDGYENLTQSMLSELTPDSLRNLAQQREETEGYLGKIVTGAQWYFAVLVSEKDAERLSLSETATLDLGKYASGTVDAVVTHISHPQNGVCAVVFKCRTAMAETLSLRELTAEIVYERTSGLRVPTKAVHVDDNGDTFVYVLSSLQVEKKTVDILVNAGDYYIVDEGSSVDSLRAGNEIVVSGRNIREGLLPN